MCTIESFVVCAGRAHVADLAAQVAGPQGDAVGVGQERRGGLEVTPVHLGPDTGRRRHRGVQHGFAASLVADDGGAAHQVVAVRVIAVVMGVDQRADRPAGDGLDGVQVGAGAPLGGGGVDADHAGVDPLTDQEAGVVQVPAAVRLQVGVDVLADLLDLAQAHRRAPSSRAAAAASASSSPKQRQPGQDVGVARDERQAVPVVFGEPGPVAVPVVVDRVGVLGDPDQAQRVVAEVRLVTPNKLAGQAPNQATRARASRRAGGRGAPGVPPPELHGVVRGHDRGGRDPHPVVVPADRRDQQRGQRGGQQPQHAVALAVQQPGSQPRRPGRPVPRPRATCAGRRSRCRSAW